MSITWAGDSISCSANKMNIAVRKNAPTPRRRLKSCRSRARRCALRHQRQLLLKACYVAPKNFDLHLMMCASKIRSPNFAFQPRHLVERLPYLVKSYLRTTVHLKSLQMFHALLIRALALSSWDSTVPARQPC